MIASVLNWQVTNHLHLIQAIVVPVERFSALSASALTFLLQVLIGPFDGISLLASA